MDELSRQTLLCRRALLAAVRRVVDKYKWRMPFMVLPQVVTLVGFAIFYAVSDKLKDNIMCAGTYPTLPGINTWSSDNLAGPAKRAMGLGFMIMMGNVSGFGGSYLFISSEAPRYPTAYGVSLGLLCVAIVASIGLDYVYWTINKRRQAMTPAEAYRRAMAHAQAKITPPSSQDDGALGDLIDLTDNLTIRQQRGHSTLDTAIGIAGAARFNGPSASHSRPNDGKMCGSVDQADSHGN